MKRFLIGGVPDIRLRCLPKGDFQRAKIEIGQCSKRSFREIDVLGTWSAPCARVNDAHEHALLGAIAD
jgi:hypothetical protein